jgi:stage VI sporulation protein D
VTEQQSGLRFDIYERVQMDEGIVEISELNEVELIPHIQVLTQDEQAILKGNLQLIGSYVGDLGEAARTLEHLIPVEITLPLNRISRVEDIVVEIENFDIDIVSPRSLNVTGVLSLQGVEMISPPSESWREEEEVVFVHEAETPQVESLHVAETPRVESVLKEPTFTAEAVNEPTAISADVAMYAPSEVTQTEIDIMEEKLSISADDGLGSKTVIKDEKKDVKLAFGKKADEAIEIKTYGIKSLLSKAGSIFQPDKRKEEEAAKAEASKAETVEWKKLFLQTEGEKQEFRKVRMCIVQKEETLEIIAKRYHVNTRELQLFNRLGDQDISAGQIIYLPK